MSKKRAVVFTSLFEFGGSNTYLKLVSDFLNDHRLYCVLNSDKDLSLFKGLGLATTNLLPHVLPNLQQIAKFDRADLLSSCKQLVFSLVSIIRVVGFLIKFRTRTIIISSVDPEKYLYFTCIPFVEVRYVLHTVPVKPGKAFTSLLCNRFLSGQKRIIAVSRYEEGELLRFWKINRGKHSYVEVIHNTVFHEEKFLKNRWNADNVVVLTLGHTVEYKNPYLWKDVALKVTALFPGITFTWVGDGTQYDELVECTKDYDRISFVKATNDIHEYLSGAYVYYQPSKVESHGIAVLEAMASSVPCVVSNAGGLPESVTNNYNGFVVDTYNVNEHVEAIVKLFSDKAMAEKFSINSLRKYKECFCNEVWRRKMKGNFEIE